MKLFCTCKHDIDQIKKDCDALIEGLYKEMRSQYTVLNSLSSSQDEALKKRVKKLEADKIQGRSEKKRGRPLTNYEGKVWNPAVKKKIKALLRVPIRKR